MSKKLIAVASAAALALTALVGIAPASAAPFAVAVDGELTGSGDGSSATAAFLVKAPYADEILLDGATGTTGTALRLAVTATTATGAITATSTGGVKVLTEELYDDGAAVSDATASVSVSAVAAAANIYVIATSTTAGTVTVTNGSNSAVISVKATVGPAYKLSFTAPSVVGASATAKIIGTVSDVFGNKIESLLKGAFDVSTVGGATVVSNTVWRATTKDYSIEITAPSTASAIAATVDLTATPDEVATLGTPVASQFFSLNTVDLATQVTALTAQVAALKADYNALAAKWNKRVADKKAPKKAVATK